MHKNEEAAPDCHIVLVRKERDSHRWGNRRRRQVVNHARQGGKPPEESTGE